MEILSIIFAGFPCLGRRELRSPEEAALQPCSLEVEHVARPGQDARIEAYDRGLEGFGAPQAMNIAPLRGCLKCDT